MEQLIINFVITVAMHYIKNPTTDAEIVALLKKLYTILSEIPGVAS